MASSGLDARDEIIELFKRQQVSSQQTASESEDLCGIIVITSSIVVINRPSNWAALSLKNRWNRLSSRLQQLLQEAVELKELKPPP